MGDRSELAARLHRLRSLLARLKIQLEMAQEDGSPPDQTLVAAGREAVDLLAGVEEVALGVDVAPRGRPVIVIEDDPLAGELLARRLRRRGVQAVQADLPLSELPSDAVLVVDLSAMEKADATSRAAVRRARPIVLTGAVGPAAGRRADALAARACLTKPAAIEQILDALRPRSEAPS